MKIIKNGNKDYLKQIKKFKCEKCGCEFEAEKGEYKYEYSQREGISWYVCKCPMDFCNNKYCISDKEKF